MTDVHWVNLPDGRQVILASRIEADAFAEKFGGYVDWAPIASPTRRSIIMPSESTRAYIYRILTFVTPLLTGYGVLSDSDAALFLGLAGAILALGSNVLASANTSTKAP